MRRHAFALLLCTLLPLGHAAPPEALPVWKLHLCANAALGEPKDNQGSPYLLLRRIEALWPQLRIQVTLLPWSRCLNEAGQGQFDGVLAASWTADRARQLAYPLNQDGDPEADKRMFRIGYALLRLRGSAIQWDGQRITGTADRAGQALGAERGYSIVSFARDHGAFVEDRYPHAGSLLESLKLKRLGGALLNQEHAASLLRDPAWAQLAELSGPALDTKNYFLPLNKALAEREPVLASQLWATVEKARTSAGFQRQFSASMSAGRRKDLIP